MKSFSILTENFSP